MVGIAQPIARGSDAHGLGREAVVGRVRPHLVVVLPPALDNGPGLSQAGEDLFVQAFVAEAADEAFDAA